SPNLLLKNQMSIQILDAGGDPLCQYRASLSEPDAHDPAIVGCAMAGQPAFADQGSHNYRQFRPLDSNIKAGFGHLGLSLSMQIEHSSRLERGHAERCRVGPKVTLHP